MPKLHNKLTHESGSSSQHIQKPVIAILGGTGKEGSGLAHRWARAGYTVIIGSRVTEKALAKAAELNERLTGNLVKGMQNSQAAQQADICVLTVVYSAQLETVQAMKERLRGKILVDATARIDFLNPKPPQPPAAALQAQEILGSETRVVAAFQNVPAHILKQNNSETLDLDVLVCSDYEEAANEVIELSAAGGMRAYYAGKLENAIVVEGLTALLISLNNRYGSRNAALHITGIGK